MVDRSLAALPSHIRHQKERINSRKRGLNERGPSQERKKLVDATEGGEDGFLRFVIKRKETTTMGPVYQHNLSNHPKPTKEFGFSTYLKKGGRQSFQNSEIEEREEAWGCG